MYKYKNKVSYVCNATFNLGNKNSISMGKISLFLCGISLMSASSFLTNNFRRNRKPSLIKKNWNL